MVRQQWAWMARSMRVGVAWKCRAHGCNVEEARVVSVALLKSCDLRGIRQRTRQRTQQRICARFVVSSSQFNHVRTRPLDPSKTRVLSENLDSFWATPVQFQVTYLNTVRVRERERDTRTGSRTRTTSSANHNAQAWWQDRDEAWDEG